MGLSHLRYRHQVINLQSGPVLGCSYSWPGGQYCVIHTDRGILACGLYDCKIAGEFGLAVAVARGTPEAPLCEPEELLKARIAEVSQAAADMGIQVGMLGENALEILLSKVVNAEEN
jgi:uncharacterized protein YunC (DUF1805 family)